MSPLIDLYLHQDPYPYLTAGGFTVLPLMHGCVHDLKYCAEIGFRLPFSIKISTQGNILMTKIPFLPLDLSPILSHIAPQISKQHD